LLYLKLLPIWLVFAGEPFQGGLASLILSYPFQFKGAALYRISNGFWDTKVFPNLNHPSFWKEKRTEAPLGSLTSGRRSPGLPCPVSRWIHRSVERDTSIGAWLCWETPICTQLHPKNESLLQKQAQSPDVGVNQQTYRQI
jgi:hypothetical protein